MKNIIIIGSLIVTWLIILSSCNKSHPTNSLINQGQNSTSNQNNQGLEKYKKYLELIHQKTRTTVTINEAVEYIEGAINYVYSRRYGYYTNRQYFNQNYPAEESMSMETIGSLYDNIVSDLHDYREGLNDDSYMIAVIDVSLSNDESGGIDVNAVFVQTNSDIPQSIPTPSSSVSYNNTDDIVCTGTAPFSLVSGSSASGSAALWFFDQWVNWPTNTPAGSVFPTSISTESFGDPSLMPNPNWVGTNSNSLLITWTGTGTGSDPWRGQCMAYQELIAYAYTYTGIYINYLMNTSTSNVYQKEYLGQSFPPTYSPNSYPSPDNMFWFGGTLWFGDYVAATDPPSLP